MTSIDEKIRLYGQNRDIEGLQGYVHTLEDKKLVDMIRNKFNSPNFESTWNLLLQGFKETPESHMKRFKIVEAVLKELENNVVTNSQCNSIIHRLCMELTNFKSDHLVQFCSFCLDCIQAQKATQMSWKELLPELLNVLVEKEQIEHNGVTITGVEYKHQIVEALCLLQWSPSIATSMASMFIDMPLTKEEHLQVVNKLGQYIEKLTPQEIPPFVYQLLTLCRDRNSRSIFLRLQHYFDVRTYENYKSQLSDSNSDNTDVEAIESASVQDTVDTESTVLYHIHSTASLGHDCIKDYLLSLSKLVKSPEFVLNPFQLNVLFIISTIPNYEEKVFEIIRSCVSRTYHEEQKKNNSAWFRDMVVASHKMETVFAQIIILSVQDRDLILQGLVNFGFVLLGVGSALGRDLIAEKQWQLGSLILLKIIKRKRHTAPSIIQQLSDCIITGQNVVQYIECLYMMTKNLPLLMLENKSSIVTLIEGLLQMPGHNANLLLDAVIPLTKVSPSIRDQLILLLRKALYSKITETRQMAVNGFLKLLSDLKISNVVAITQSTFAGSFSSGHSLFTQISMNRTSQCPPSAFSNEALCLEILSILRRCFVQQVEVRSQLYDGLYDTVCLNPELAIPVLEIMWTHFNAFYNIDDEILPPIKFDKILLSKDVSVKLQEPVGKLIYIMGLIVTTAARSDGENSTVVKTKKMLESLSSRMINCELVHLELDDGTDLLDIMPESQQKLTVLKEAMCVYEALIGYKIFSWRRDFENQAKEVMGLFQGYQRLVHFSKNISKPKKADSKKKKTDNDATTQQTNSTTTTRKDGQKTIKAFKAPDTVLDFQVMNRIMMLLHEPMVTWSTKVNANIVKSKREFHQHMMQSLLNLLTSVKQKKYIEVQCAKIIYSYLCEMSILLYERIIKRLAEFIDFDGTTAVLAADCFFVILTIICSHFKNNFTSFISKVVGRDKDEGLSVLLSDVVQTYQNIFETDEGEISEDPEAKKLPAVVINTLSLLSHQIPVESNSMSLQLMEWLKNYAVNNTILNKVVCTTFVNLMLDTNLKFKLGLKLVENLSLHIGDVTGVINEEERSDEEFKIISELNVNNVLISVCSTLKTVLEDVEWIIVRLKAEFCMVTYPGETNLERRIEILKTKEKGVCCQLIFIVTILTNLSNCTVPPGNLFETILKNLILLYSTLSSFARYFISRSSKNNPVFQGARFERLVKLTGKQLSPTVYKLIMYIEESQKQEPIPTQTQKSKKKSIDTSTLKSKVLKETRLIPKVIYEIEQFSKYVIQLSKKTKIDLSKFVGQGTVRDFRILHLKEVLEQATDGAPVTQVTQESDSSVVEMEAEDVTNDDSHGGSDEEQTPPTKKSKR